MKLSNSTPRSDIDIWQPRWSDRKVLIAKYKVKEHNKVTFSKAPTMKDDYYLSGETIKKYPLETNGKIACYAVHLDELEALEIEDGE